MCLTSLPAASLLPAALPDGEETLSISRCRMDVLGSIARARRGTTALCCEGAGGALLGLWEVGNTRNRHCPFVSPCPTGEGNKSAQSHARWTVQTAPWLCAFPGCQPKALREEHARAVTTSRLCFAHQGDSLHSFSCSEERTAQWGAERDYLVCPEGQRHRDVNWKALSLTKLGMSHGTTIAWCSLSLKWRRADVCWAGWQC